MRLEITKPVKKIRQFRIRIFLDRSGVMSHRTNTVSRGIPGAGIFQGEEFVFNATNKTIECQENPETAAGIIFLVSGLGIGANVMIMFLILVRKNLRR